MAPSYVATTVCKAFLYFSDQLLKAWYVQKQWIQRTERKHQKTTTSQNKHNKVNPMRRQACNLEFICDQSFMSNFPRIWPYLEHAQSHTSFYLWSVNLF